MKPERPRPTASAEAISQIERTYPGYHVWVSDQGWWYATLTRPRARGQAATVHAPGPAELAEALATEEAAAGGHAVAAAW